MTDRIYEFYILDPTGSRHKIFRGTVKNFQKVEELYGELWGEVIDSQLGLLGDEHAGVLTDDPILQNWEGVDITAVDFTTCLLYTSPSPRDGLLSRMPSSA